MEDENVIVLSDSSDSVSLVEPVKNEAVQEDDALSNSSFEFPEVRFDYKKKESELPRQVENEIDSAFDSYDTNNFYGVEETDLEFNSSHVKEVEYISSEDIDLGIQNSPKWTQSPRKIDLQSDSSSESSIDSILGKNGSKSKRVKTVIEKRKIKPRSGKNVDPEKERLKAERLKKKEEMAKEKALKAVAMKNFKKLKPEESIKSMKVLFDEEIRSCDYFTDLLSTLREFDISFIVESQLIPRSITWKREIEENYLGQTSEICTRTTLKEENHIISIWNWDEVVDKVSNGMFCTSIANMCALLPRKRLTLIIHGIMDYFAYQKNLRDKAVRNDILGNEKKKSYSKQDKLYKGCPKMSRNDLEICLAEIQIANNCSCRFVQSSQELALVIYQYTKAIAEIPYKLEKNRNLEDKVSWYAAGDNRDTVKVDKDGNGLKRLWQQQLCQFNLSSLETAEGICLVYRSPLQLIEAYTNCTPAEGEMLLKDIPIRRAAGPVTTARKIGPELSKKVYTMFSTEDGEALLNND